MTYALHIRNDDSRLEVSSKQSLAVEITAEKLSPVFVVLPLGDDGASALMTRAEYGRLKLILAEAGDKADVSTQPPDAGEGRIRIDWADTTFCVVLKDFTTNAASGQVTLHLEDADRQVLASTELTVAEAPPRITSFTSNSYNVINGSDVTLSWQLSPPGHAVLQQVAPRPDDERQGRLKEMTSPADLKTPEMEKEGCSRYRLDAMQKGAVTDSRFISIYTYGKSQVISHKGPGDHKSHGLRAKEILGVYNRTARSQLYALVRDVDPAKLASIWTSDIGFDPESWRLLTNARDEPVTIPVDAAERPGVVLDDKLYLVGGSSFDANCPGRRMEYFDFSIKTWCDEERAGDDDAWPPKMPARMGHSVLAAPDDQTLWVLGGADESGAALNDIWRYDKRAAPKNRWEPQAAPTWEPRCLFGATFLRMEDGTYELWIAGGFDSPGGYPTYDDVHRCSDVSKSASWEKVGLLTKEPDNRAKQFCGCCLITLQGRVLAFSAYADIRLGHSGVQKVTSFTFSNNRWRPNENKIDHDWLGDSALDWYRLDATEWNGCIFLRRLDRTHQKNALLRYYVSV